jgi:pyruvate dehydrogenase E2 component (dihydrolipoamide acetyltransferase)
VLKPYTGTTAWRKITIGTWRRAGDPSIYSSIEFDARPLLAKMAELKQQNIEISPTIIAAKAIAIAIKENDSLNAFVRLGRVYHRNSVDIFLQVAPKKNQDDLSGVVIRNCANKTFSEIASEFYDKAKQIRKGDDKSFERTKKLFHLLPGWFVGPLIDVMGFILYTLNIWSPLVNAPKDGFGSAMLTSIGSLGLDHAFAPLVPYSRCPFVIAVGKIKDQVVAVDGVPEVVPMISFCATLDHRIVDGVGAAKLVKSLRRYMANPY